MAHDTVTIVSMDSAREGFKTLPKSDRGAFLDRLLNGIKPDIAHVTGDIIKTTAFLQGYGQYLSPDGESTLMLYDENKIEMKKQKVPDSVFEGMEGIGTTKIVWPKVQVFSLQPARQVVKTFTLLAFPSDFFTTNNERSNEQLLRKVAMLARGIVAETGNPILIAGQIRLLPFEAVDKIVSEFNNETQHQYLEYANTHLNNVGYLPSMVKGSTYENRQHFKFVAIRCKRTDTVVKKGADCMLASKSLEFSEAKGIEIERILGQRVTMPTMKNSCVYQSEMKIPVRPPRYHGG